MLARQVLHQPTVAYVISSKVNPQIQFHFYEPGWLFLVINSHIRKL